MPIKQTTPKAALEAAINSRVEAIMQSLVNVLHYVGEEVIRYARDPNRKRYTDQTGNLTSSIGYVVLYDGKVMHQSNFERVRGRDTKKRAGKLDGTSKGKEFLQKLIRENQQGLVLIVVAGMPYAAYVEAMGKDVLDSAEIKAQEMVTRLLKRLKF